MPFRRILRVIPLSVAALVFSCLAWGLVSGLEEGFFYGVFSSPPSNGLIAHGPNFYQELNVAYFWIVMLTVALIILTFWSNEVANITKISLCCACIFPYWNIFSLKLSVLGLERCCTDYPWLRTTLYLDIVAAVGIVAILSLEILFLFKARNRLETIREFKN